MQLSAANAAAVKAMEDLGADTYNVPTDLSLAQLAAIRAATDLPLDVYVEVPDDFGGFVRHYEIPDLVRVASPVFVKFGLRNAPNIYPSGTHLEATAVALGRERVRRARIGQEMLAALLPRGRGHPAGRDLPRLARRRRSEGEGMKITHVETFVVGTEWRNLTIVRAHTDEGLTGLGEARMVNHTDALVGYLAEAAPRHLVGHDPFRIEELVKKMGRDDFSRAGEVMSSGIAMFETACWDIVGKALGQPVYNLLGGPVSDRVKAYANGWYRVERTPEEFHEAAKKVVERGYRALEAGSLRSRTLRAGVRGEDAGRLARRGRQRRHRT